MFWCNWGFDGYIDSLKFVNEDEKTQMITTAIDNMNIWWNMLAIELFNF